jgi:hypothetical protein
VVLLAGDVYYRGQPLSEQMIFGQCSALVYVIDAQDEPYQVRLSFRCDEPYQGTAIDRGRYQTMTGRPTHKKYVRIVREGTMLHTPLNRHYTLCPPGVAAPSRCS